MAALRTFLFAFLTFVTVTGWTVKAQALFIYLDMNNNPEEHAVFRKAVKALGTGERIAFIPEENEVNSVHLKALTQKRDRIWENYVKHGCLAEVACHPELGGKCGEIQKSLRASEAEVAKSAKIPLSEVTMLVGLHALSKSLRTDEPITLVISGHFGGGTFTGNLGSFSVTEIERIFSSYPELRSRVTDLNLLGCYTNTLSQVTPMWRRAFPNARVLVGFFGSSPRGESPVNLAFIRDLVKFRASVDQVRSETDFQEQLNRLQKYKAINVALCVDDYYQQTNGQLMRVSDERAMSAKCVADLPTAERDYFEKVRVGELPVPTSTSESRLRSYYTALRAHATCLDEPDYKTTVPNVPHPDKVIRLILYKSVVQNFRNIHGSDLANFDTLLQTTGVRPELALKNLNLNDRKAMVDWKKAVEQNLGTVADRKKVQPLLTILNQFSDILINLEPRCIPFQWVEPSASQRSECFQVKGMCS